MITRVKGKEPQIDATAFVHKSAVVAGDVVLKEYSSIWPCASLRGDVNQIIIGKNSNVQDNSVLHTNDEQPLLIGDNVVVGHNVNMHSCVIGDGSLIGIGAIILDGAKIGKNCLVAAGALITPNKEFPDGSMIMGSPAKVVRELTKADTAYQQMLVEHYKSEAKDYTETEEEI
ncbi:MAG: gamma carbonic anhydrase family protein [Christensenella sp.]